MDCVFGSRFIEGGVVTDYPKIKLLLNRLFNFVLRVSVDRKLNDFTNAFKAYRRVVIDDCRPFSSEHFSLTIEIPLKAIKKGFKYSVVPITWMQRKYGYSKLGIMKNAPSYFKILRLFLTDKL
jgi:dolichol-phosphate mannosyltransferase